MDLTVNGARVRVRHAASHPGAPTVVMLHMAGGSSAVFGPLSARLGRWAEVFAPDFPGHGQSGDGGITPGPGLLGRYAAWTAAFVREIGRERVILVGHSMGGMVAMLCALDGRMGISGLGLVCTSARVRLPPGLREAIEHDYESFAGGFVIGALPSTAGLGAGIQAKPIFPAADQAVVQADFAAVDGFDVLDRLSQVRVPSVVVGGLDDRITPPPHSHALGAALSGKVHLLEGGHLLPREAPARVAEALETLF